MGRLSKAWPCTLFLSLTRTRTHNEHHTHTHRQLTLGLEEEKGQQQQRDSALSAALINVGYGLLKSVASSSIAVDNDSVVSSALAATLGEALVTVVSKGLLPSSSSSSDRGRLGWEGWLAALPPPNNSAADVEGVIEAGLAWVAAAATGAAVATAPAEDKDKEGGGAFAPPSSLPSPLGTRARAILLAGARATVQVRCCCVR